MLDEKKDHILSQLQFRVKGMLVVLFLQYLAGMVLNMFGSDDPSKRTLLASVAFFTHIILAVLLLIGSIVIWSVLRHIAEKQLLKIARHGFWTIVIAILAGIATMLLKETPAEIFSIIMALSFLGAFASYGHLFFLLNKSVLTAKNS